MELRFSDATVITITTTDTSKPALIINIYNPCNNSILADLHDHLRTNINISEYGTIIIAGDFNTHHPLWNPTGYTRHDEEADTLIDMMAELGLCLISELGTVTFPNAGTTIDLVWGNDEAVKHVILCQIARKNDHA